MLFLQARLFVEAGVRKVRLTGGEPTLRSDLPSLCGQLTALPGLRTLAMTSNGIVLARQLPELKAAGKAGEEAREAKASTEQHLSKQYVWGVGHVTGAAPDSWLR
jgi:uncharacterized radical SAM superfamily Fe-S cluster-containing enzyme